MKAFAFVVLAGCWTSSPPPPLSAKRSEPATETCASFREETRGFRDAPQMVEAAAARLAPTEPLFVQPMSGPHANVDAACEQCDRNPGAGRFRELATGGRDLALRIENQWWWVSLAINDTCYLAYDAPIVRDLLAAAPGDELFLRVTMTCPQAPEPFGDPEPERSEHIAICGVGESGRPSCMQASFGRTAFKPEYSEHTRLDLACDGTATFTTWDGDDGLGYRYVRKQAPLVLR